MRLRLTAPGNSPEKSTAGIAGPGDAACCLLASRGRQAVSQPCRRTVSDHAWLVLGQVVSMRYDWRHAPCRNHTPLSSRNRVPDQATRSSSLRMREPAWANTTSMYMQSRERKKKLRKTTRPMDDGCGAR